MNELLLIIEIISTFSLILVAKKLFGKTGLYAWIAIASILANIQVAKSVNMFGLETSLGNVLFASTFLVTDILSENYGKKTARKGVYIGLSSVIIYLIVTQISLLYEANSIDIASDAMNMLFGLSPRICLSSVFMYFIANMADVWLFDKLKVICKGKKLWLRNNLATIICNGGENFLFTFFAFYGIYSGNDILSIAIGTTIIELLIALCDTPFLYLSKRVKEREL